MSLTLCVLLWSVGGQEDRLSAYEDEVLALVPEHGGEVVTRVRRVDVDVDLPYEVQVIALPDQRAMDGFLADPRRTALSGVRDEVVERTEIIRVSPVAVS